MSSIRPGGCTQWVSVSVLVCVWVLRVTEKLEHRGGRQPLPLSRRQFSLEAAEGRRNQTHGLQMSSTVERWIKILFCWCVAILQLSHFLSQFSKSSESWPVGDALHMICIVWKEAALNQTTKSSSSSLKRVNSTFKLIVWAFFFFLSPCKFAWCWYGEDGGVACCVHMQGASTVV